MSDSRMSFLKSVRESLAGTLDPQQASIVIDKITLVLNDYELMERCTELITVDPTNEKLLKRYCACLMVDGKSEKTIYQYRRTLIRLSDFFREKPYTEMGVYDIRYYFACEKERGVSNVTLENTRANISAFYQWMTLEDLIPKNPMLLVNKISCPDEIKLPFSEVEIDSLKSACKTLKERALIEMLLSTGVRVSELSEMMVSDVDFITMDVHVKHGKGAKERKTYTTEVSARHMKKYLENRKEKDSPYLFCNSAHKMLKPSGIRYILNGIAKRAGVANVHPHRFRRTFATGLAKRGMDIQEIQRLLGHTKLDTTMKYVCIDDDSVKTSYKKYIA